MKIIWSATERGETHLARDAEHGNALARQDEHYIQRVLDHLSDKLELEMGITATHQFNLTKCPIAAITVAATQSSMTERRIAPIFPMLKTAVSEVTRLLHQ